MIGVPRTYPAVFTTEPPLPPALSLTRPLFVLEIPVARTMPELLTARPLVLPPGQFEFRLGGLDGAGVADAASAAGCSRLHHHSIIAGGLEEDLITRGQRGSSVRRGDSALVLNATRHQDNIAMRGGDRAEIHHPRHRRAGKSHVAAAEEFAIGHIEG